MMGIPELVHRNEVATAMAIEQLIANADPGKPTTFTVGEQVALDGTRRPIKRMVLSPARVAELREIAEADQHECDAGWNHDHDRHSWGGRGGHPTTFYGHSRTAYPVYYYSDPWQEEPDRVLWYCSNECREADDGDFTPEYCDSCEREICQRCESNGWRGYFRYHDGWLECVRCWQERMLKSGVSRKRLVRLAEEGEGMPTDFMNDGDLEEAGYVRDDIYFISGTSGAKTVGGIALHLHDEGNDVVFCSERMAIGGGEGSVSIWYRPREENE